MEQPNQKISDIEIIMLNAYLHQIFSIENKCKDNFERTEWYLSDKYSKNEVEEIINYFKFTGVKCDCDLIKKFDITYSKISETII